MRIATPPAEAKLCFPSLSKTARCGSSESHLAGAATRQSVRSSLTHPARERRQYSTKTEVLFSFGSQAGEVSTLFLRRSQYCQTETQEADLEESLSLRGTRYCLLIAPAAVTQRAFIQMTAGGFIAVTTVASKLFVRHHPLPMHMLGNCICLHSYPPARVTSLRRRRR